MRDPIKILLPPLILVLINYVFYFTGGYVFFPLIDIPMHFLGGIIISTSSLIILRIAERKGYIKTTPISSFIIIFCSVITLAVFWEFFEFIESIVLSRVTQPSVADTIKDLFFGMLGGTVGWFIQKGKV